ncbi:hypothetical protein SAMN05421771_0790 [Granulicella pectinivorans]|uniref:Uncharacterized protein n=1 Tax=Granulicella pectinivorans TaxID=474950 RepID=A0A1I6LJS9_9BACT|nr:hypothetical protein [Granulicella pectinivorans]SFS03572.1 hypothetical protein SAMN05421771_0790 [Granulicella pectinivorans]
MSQSTVSYLWREPNAAKPFATGVSLHSHTSQSRETLDFIAELSTDWKPLQPILRWLETRCEGISGIKPDYARAFWTPPLTPRLAFDLERSQIEDKLALPALVSLTDHDDISAPMLLRAVPSARHIPVSLEWTVPFNCQGNPQAGKTCFHLGIHNLPSAEGPEWMARFTAFTATPVEERAPALLNDLLAELAAIPQVLIVFNHPLWDLYRIGAAKHQFLVNDFLALHGQYCHALELNGLRNWDENREVTALAERWNQLVLSGGDRHGIEPNANVNLSRARTFNDFVHELRVERQSHVLFMPQYAEPWKHRILQSTLDAIRNHPHFPEGTQNWDERVFHPNANGDMVKLSTLWPDPHAPRYLSMILSAVRLLGARPVSHTLRMAWNDRQSAADMQGKRLAPRQA